ncbi:MAG TPA: hypothetical protein VH593_23350 [Ktedonobacteraceae bacterium]
MQREEELLWQFGRVADALETHTKMNQDWINTQKQWHKEAQADFERKLAIDQDWIDWNKQKQEEAFASQAKAIATYFEHPQEKYIRTLDADTLAQMFYEAELCAMASLHPHAYVMKADAVPWQDVPDNRKQVLVAAARDVLSRLAILAEK